MLTLKQMLEMQHSDLKNVRMVTNYKFQHLVIQLLLKVLWD